MLLQTVTPCCILSSPVTLCCILPSPVTPCCVLSRGVLDQPSSVASQVRVNIVGAAQRTLRGRAVSINQEQVTLALGRDFEKGYTDGLKVEICFVLSRVPLQLFHEGLAQVTATEPIRNRDVTAT